MPEQPSSRNAIGNAPEVQNLEQRFSLLDELAKKFRNAGYRLGMLEDLSRGEPPEPRNCDQLAPWQRNLVTAAYKAGYCYARLMRSRRVYSVLRHMKQQMLKQMENPSHKKESLDLSDSAMEKVTAPRVE